MTDSKVSKRCVLPALLLCVACAAVFMTGCKRDVMYGPGGEIIKMKSPDRTMRIDIRDDKIDIKGARGIGGRSRVRIPPVPVETEEDTVGVHGVMVPPPAAPVVPVVPVRERSVEVEQQTVVH